MNPEVVLFPGINLGSTPIGPIEFKKSTKETGSDGYDILEFEYPTRPDYNGGYFRISPNDQTKAGHIIDGDTVVELEVVGGSGVCQAAKYVNQIDKESERPPYNYFRLYLLKTGHKFRFKKGDVYRLIAGDEGMLVRSDTHPPHRRGITEEILEESDPCFPDDFRFYRTEDSLAPVGP